MLFSEMRIRHRRGAFKMIHPLSDHATAINPDWQCVENWAFPSSDDSPLPGILVADDDQSIRDLLRAKLRNRGFTVWLAADGEEALEMYGLHQNEIGLVLLDVRLPRLDGPETLGVMREFDPSVECCFMGGRLGVYTMEHLEALTPLPFFEKPFRVLETVEALWQLVGAQLNGKRNIST